jgi:hypothetical protein
VRGLLLARKRPSADRFAPFAAAAAAATEEEEDEGGPVRGGAGRGEPVLVARDPLSGVLGFLGTSTLTVRILGFCNVLEVNLGCLENILGLGKICLSVGG